ncbi:hypothetical protein V6N11_000102 [Hibiscus sabdariffa]|uniref:Uncharacterized protein n=1 Tax=Hibiscus sabdariffa TaxID=183260 RepID=A0ABR2NP67_9ROSI
MPTYDSTWNTKLAILITSEQLEESISTNGLVLFFGIGRKRVEKKGNAFYTIYGMVGGIISECAQLPIRFKDAFSKVSEEL